MWAVRYDLNQMLSNVIRNAFEAMPDGGTLRIDCQVVFHSGRDVVQIVVADTGVGISRTEQLRIFEPFFSTKKRMGYGLWDSKNLAEGMGGSIEVDSEVGKGTTFSIYLPREFKVEKGNGSQ